MVKMTNQESIIEEYYEIFHVVNDFDRRLMTVKGWGVTLSLAALAWGFQYQHYGLFLVSAMSGVTFWLIEGTMKRHQMRYYLRMREIEVLQFEKSPDDAKNFSSPRIDYSWTIAATVYSRGRGSPFPSSAEEKRISYLLAWLFPHVLLPHIVSIIAGVVLFFLGLKGYLGEMGW